MHALEKLLKACLTSSLTKGYTVRITANIGKTDIVKFKTNIDGYDIVKIIANIDGNERNVYSVTSLSKIKGHNSIIKAQFLERYSCSKS